MSPQLRTTRRGDVRPARYQALQPAAVVWLTLVWVVLWRDLSLGNLVLGLVVAVVVCVVFPLPPVRMRMRIRPVALAWTVVRFLADVVVSSVHVAYAVLRPRHRPRNAVIEVDLTSSSDLVLTIVAQMTSLIPGSIVVEARRSTHTLFLHVFDVGDAESADRFRGTVLAQEARVLRALGAGSPADAPEGATG